MRVLVPAPVEASSLPSWVPFLLSGATFVDLNSVDNGTSQDGAGNIDVEAIGGKNHAGALEGAHWTNALLDPAGNALEGGTDPVVVTLNLQLITQPTNGSDATVYIGITDGTNTAWVGFDWDQPGNPDHYFGQGGSAATGGNSSPTAATQALGTFMIDESGELIGFIRSVKNSTTVSLAGTTGGSITFSGPLSVIFSQSQRRVTAAAQSYQVRAHHCFGLPASGDTTP